MDTVRWQGKAVQEQQLRVGQALRCQQRPMLRCLRCCCRRPSVRESGQRREAPERHSQLGAGRQIPGGNQLHTRLNNNSTHTLASQGSSAMHRVHLVASNKDEVDCIANEAAQHRQAGCKLSTCAGSRFGVIEQIHHRHKTERDVEAAATTPQYEQLPRRNRSPGQLDSVIEHRSKAPPPLSD